MALQVAPISLLLIDVLLGCTVCTDFEQRFCTRRSQFVVPPRHSRPPRNARALFYAIKVLEKLNPENDDQKVGIDIVRRALKFPLA